MVWHFLEIPDSKSVAVLIICLWEPHLLLVWWSRVSHRHSEVNGQRRYPDWSDHSLLTPISYVQSGHGGSFYVMSFQAPACQCHSILFIIALEGLWRWMFFLQKPTDLHSRLFEIGMFKPGGETYTMMSYNDWMH